MVENRRSLPTTRNLYIYYCRRRDREWREIYSRPMYARDGPATTASRIKIIQTFNSKQKDDQNAVFPKKNQTWPNVACLRGSWWAGASGIQGRTGKSFHSRPSEIGPTRGKVVVPCCGWFPFVTDTAGFRYQPDRLRERTAHLANSMDRYQPRFWFIKESAFGGLIHFNSEFAPGLAYALKDVSSHFFFHSFSFCPSRAIECSCSPISPPPTTTSSRRQLRPAQAHRHESDGIGRGEVLFLQYRSQPLPPGPVQQRHDDRRRRWIVRQATTVPSDDRISQPVDPAKRKVNPSISYSFPSS